MMIPLPLPKPPSETVIPYASEGGHWYDRQGNPVYEVPARNGSMRATTLRDARKLDLVPSVTTIMRCAYNYNLERWKDEQLLLAALTLPRLDGEDMNAFAARIVKDAEEQAITARDTGSAIHESIEKCLCGHPYSNEHVGHVDGAVDAMDRWCGIEGVLPEKSFAHELGFGGKTDVHKPQPPLTGWVADFKCKDFGPRSLPKLYDNHPMQLAAYREGFGMPHARCAIIFVSTRVPGLSHLVEIDEDELARGWNMFNCLLQFWQAKNRHV